MPDKIVNHFVLADGSVAKYDAGSLLNLDETVSLAGYAPDAKAVGDRLTELANELYSFPQITVDWSIGELNSNGTINQRNAGIRTHPPFYLTKGSIVNIETTGYKFNLARYETPYTSSYVSGSYRASSSGNPLTISDDGYYIVSIWHSNNSPFADTSESSVVTIIRKDSNIETLENKVETLEENVREETKFKSSPLYRSNTRFGKTPNNYYNGKLTTFSADALNRNTTTNEMLALFDTLVDGTYITKKDLGVCSDETHHLFEYDLTPTQCDLSVSGISYTTKSIPKFLITSAQHGFEKGSVYGLYYFIRDVVENWNEDPVLAYIRNHVELKIIPICNPYGFDNNSYYNANGVNLNRNYDTDGFDGSATPGTSSYGGTVANSEPETQIICNFIKNNLDAWFLFDFHTNGQYAVSEQRKINWLDFAPIQESLFEQFKYVAQTHIENISMHFSNDYELEENSPVGYVTSGVDGYTADFPSVDCWTLAQGLCGHTIEGFCGFPNGETFTESVCKANAEIIGNWISEVINYLQVI